MKPTKIELVKSPLVSNIFLLRVDAVFDIACTKVSGIVKENEYENIIEGGVNDYVQLRRKPSSKANIMEIERYIGENFFDPLPVGRRLIMPIVLYVCRNLGGFANAPVIFTLSGCTVCGKKYGELNAEHSGLMTETTQIAYQQAVMVNTMVSIEDDVWSFDKSGNNYRGEGSRHANYDRREVRKRDMEKMSRKWPEKRSARTI